MDTIFSEIGRVTRVLLTNTASLLSKPPPPLEPFAILEEISAFRHYSLKTYLENSQYKPV